MALGKRKGEEKESGSHADKRRKEVHNEVTAPSKEGAPFPRGGGSVLTPLEQRQIQIQAQQDVLFEQQMGRKAPEMTFDADENEIFPENAINGEATRGPKKRKKTRTKPDRRTDVVNQTRIESLSYKRIVPGSILLGQVSQINRDDITISLPNNLSGFVPLTGIPDTLTQQIEASDEENEDDDQQAPGDVNQSLERFVSVGQYLRVYVVSTQDETIPGGKPKRHIELSLHPRQANAGLTPSDCVENSMIQATVTSVEDHGVIMNLGLNDINVKGFVASKDLASDRSHPAPTIGSVHLCMVLGKSANGKILKLSLDSSKASNVKKAFVTDTPSVDSLLPGTAIEFLVTAVKEHGLVGKFMGLLDVTVDLVHSGIVADSQKIRERLQPGDKVKGRVICTFAASDKKKLGVSRQDHILLLRLRTAARHFGAEELEPTKILPISSIVESARIVRVEPGTGLFLDLGVKSLPGFAHISKISDSKIETLSETLGPYKLGSHHQARVTSYNHMDGLFIVSLEPNVIAQPFLRLEDVSVGGVVEGKIEKILVNEHGMNGLIVEIAKDITGLVPDVHFADVRLQHPERKYREGMSVTARVLNVDTSKRQIRLTLKKSLVNSDAEPWVNYGDLKVGMQSPGTLINILPNGAVVQFSGSIRGFLPISEMSESFIQDPRQHFQTGQVVNVRIVAVNQADKRMSLSCKDPSTSESASTDHLKIGDVVSGQILEKLDHDFTMQVMENGEKGKLSFEHLVDGSAAKAASAAKKFRAGQVLSDVLILNVRRKKGGVIQLTRKPSLLAAARDNKLLRSIEDVVEGTEVSGYVNNVTSVGVFVRFAGDFTGLLLKRQLLEENAQLPDFGLRLGQSISARVLIVDLDQAKFLLTQKRSEVSERNGVQAIELSDTKLSNPIDESSTDMREYTVGKLTKARIVSIKETQLNVLLADGVQGRIDVSEVFDDWNEVKDRKSPLRIFHPKQVLPVRILGIHDSRNHRFLPISHRQGKIPVFELTAKHGSLSDDLKILSLDHVTIGSTWVVAVNNVKDDHVWVNLSPNVRGRIRSIDICSDLSLLKNLAQNFPIGSLLRAKVIHVDVINNRLDLTARSDGSSRSVTLKDLSPGTVLPGRVTKVTERSVMIQLSDSLFGNLHMIDMSDDYSSADTSLYTKNQIVRVYVKDVDEPSKRITLSARASKVLSSSLKVRDPDVISPSQLKVNDVVRGFVKNVADQGLFVSIGTNITAFVKISNLSDKYIKDWKSDYEIDQLVKGKVVEIDESLNHIQMSLKRSHLDKAYVPPLTFEDLRVDQVVAGKVRKVEDFGVFIVVDHSANVSGLCHRTKLSDRPKTNPKTLYEEGDIVKAKVLSIDNEKRRISFGLKASYFPNGEDQRESDSPVEEDDKDSDVIGGAELAPKETLPNDRFMYNEQIGPESDDDVEDDDLGTALDEVAVAAVTTKSNRFPHSNPTIHTGGFDWTGGAKIQDSDSEGHSSSSTSSNPQKKRRRKATIKVDKTGDLDAHGPQSVSDFERLLLGQPNSSLLWLQYMAFHLQLSEVDRARDIAERALKTIHIREESEKLNVWVGLLNLEHTYGTDESLEGIFKRASSHNDSQETHERLISILIQSGAHDKADERFQTALKTFSDSPDLYTNYATFLFTTLASPDRARALLPRAMQTLAPHVHVGLTSKFAQLEFKHGDPERGRTIFETLLSQWPKRLDLWNVLLDMEIALHQQIRAQSPPAAAAAAADTADEKSHRHRPQMQDNGKIIRHLFERITSSSSTSSASATETDRRLKPKKAKFFFKRWLDFEQKAGDAKNVQRVKALAEDYVRNHR